MFVRLTIFYLFLSLCLNKAHGHEVTGTPNSCTISKDKDTCDVKANDIIEFDMTCAPSFKDDYSLLKLPKGSFVTTVDAAKIQFHIANVVEKDETITFTQRCSGESVDKTKTINHKASGSKLELPGADFTGSSIHFAISETTLTEDKTFEVKVGKWEKNKTIGIACPHAQLNDMVCFSKVIDDKNADVTLDTLIPEAKFEYLKLPFAHKTIKHIESLVTITDIKAAAKDQPTSRDFSFKCKCTVTNKIATVHFTGTVEFLKEEGGGGIDPATPEGTDPNFVPNTNGSLTTSVHNMFGLLCVFLFFYLNEY